MLFGSHCSLEQGFSTFNVNRNHLGILLKFRFGFNLRLCILNKLPWRLILLVQGLCFSGLEFRDLLNTVTLAFRA
jgi:hypothetical protein